MDFLLKYGITHNFMIVPDLSRAVRTSLQKTSVDFEAFCHPRFHRVKKCTSMSLLRHSYSDHTTVQKKLFLLSRIGLLKSCVCFFVEVNEIRKKRHGFEALFMCLFSNGTEFHKRIKRTFLKRP